MQGLETRPLVELFDVDEHVQKGKTETETLGAPMFKKSEKDKKNGSIDVLWKKFGILS